MSNNPLQKTARVILWIARISNLIFLLFLVFMVGSHLYEALFGTGDSDGNGFNSVGEMLLFIFCFPVGTMVGLALAWKWEGIGGLIATGSIIGLFIVRPGLSSNPYFIGMGVCGLLFLIYWVLNRQASGVHKMNEIDV